MNNPVWALGLMSGTSADGIDGALLQTDGIRISAFGPTHFMPYPNDLKREILKASGHPPNNDAHSLGQILTEYHAEVVFTLLKNSSIKPNLIGFHGQTLYHKPPHETHQIGDGERLAVLTGISVIDQFRLNDIAHGGQGAPLVPLFHQALAHDFKKPLAVLNIGGVANVTWIGTHEDDLIAFDTGPGNGLIDDWVLQHRDLPMDVSGAIAAQGRVNDDLLNRWLMHPYFSQRPPKSLDRKTFEDCLRDVESIPFEDGIATLTAFTAASIEKAIMHFPGKPHLWIAAGGGTHNHTLMKMIKDRIGSRVQMSSDLNWNNDALEAQAFGFLAVRSLRGLPLSLPRTTGVPFPLTGGRICAVTLLSHP